MEKRGKRPGAGGFGARTGAGGGYKAREGGYKPRAPRGEGGYKPRAEGSEGGYRPRREGGFEGGERRPYQRREEGERRPYTPRAPRGEGGYKPRAEGSEGGYRPRREGGFEGGERRPYQRREEGERRPYTPRAPRGEGGYKPRFEGSEGGFRSDDRKPFRQEGRPAPRTRKVERFEADAEPKGKQVELQHPQADGWLIGPHAVKAALKAGRRALKTLWLAEEATGDLIDLIEKHPGLKVELHPKPLFTDMFGELVHQGIALEVGNLPQPTLEEVLEQKPNLLIALDQITDPHNLGAILRSAAAFGAGAAITTERRAAGVTPVVAKAAAGGLELVPFVEITNLSQGLKKLVEEGYEVVGLAGEGAETLSDVKAKLTPGAKLCVVMGSEGDGLRRLTREHCTHVAKIPMPGQMESLNVSVATGIALYELTR